MAQLVVHNESSKQSIRFTIPDTLLASQQKLQTFAYLLNNGYSLDAALREAENAKY